ncbi:MAG: thiamine phosphate synthase [Spirulinaceae cyanobacterium]
MDDQFSWTQQKAIYRILDANLDRAREGLRIIEEWCRFGLNNSELARECKQMRQELGAWHDSTLRYARDTPGDPGTALSHPHEERRFSLEALLQANLCRVEEALRVLEEYAKLYKPTMAKACKQMRYRTYTLESALIASQRHEALKQALLYLVTTPSERLLETVEAALQGGLSLVQYRSKEADDRLRYAEAQALCQLCHKYNALFLVNDRIDIAIAVDADGVHLGQQDAPIALARELLGQERIIGRSTTNATEMQNAIAEGADYIGVGPVYATPTKEGKKPAGLEYVQYAAQNCPIPWYCIGGIDPKNVQEVLGAGGDRVAVVRAVMQAEQPTLVTQYFLSQLTKKQKLSRVD